MSGRAWLVSETALFFAFVHRRPFGEFEVSSPTDYEGRLAVAREECEAPLNVTGVTAAAKFVAPLWSMCVPKARDDTVRHSQSRTGSGRVPVM